VISDIADRRLRWIFLDLNSFFASVEQSERPELRDRPVAVVPMETDSTCAIAASYQAKAYGVKTGTNVGEARRMCPEIVFVKARPKLYVEYHERILEEVEQVLPIDKVCSIDEMRFRLLGEERRASVARQLALRLKERIRGRIAEPLTCSVGIAPNPFLAKVATELEKPDGLVVLEAERAEAQLRQLELMDFPGINKRMRARLEAHGIFSAADLLEADRQEIKTAFGSVVGERWWYLLRGYDLPDPVTHRRSISHSHVLPPDLRTQEGSKQVLLRLLQKGCARLRDSELFAARFGVSVSGRDRSWKREVRVEPSQETRVFHEKLLELWQERDFDTPRKVGIVLSDLEAREQHTPSLFDETQDEPVLGKAIDRVNKRFGKNSIYLAAIHRAKDSAEEKIAFQKTQLFNEGAEPEDRIDTRRPWQHTPEQKRG
jgi:DNA polymerase-4